MVTNYLRVFAFTIATEVPMLTPPIHNNPDVVQKNRTDVAPDSDRDGRIREQAKKFEAAFIAEMLKHSGMSDALNNGGGFGGDAFSSIMLEQYADKIIENGGFGLAEHTYEQLRERESSNGTDISA